MSPDAEPPQGTRASRAWLTLGLLLVAALALHVWMLDARWINPDEGAHLMDGKLALEGLVPGVDFGARQPFYVYATAAVLRIFSVGLASGRVLALVSTLGAGVFIFLIGRELFERSVGLLAAALFLFLPFPLFLTAHAKTEPLTIFLACGAIWCGVRALQRARGGVWLFAGAGAFAALGYYVRESSLAVLLALGIVVLVTLRREPRRMLGATGWIGTGFAGVCVVVGALYLGQQAPLSDVVRSESLNPAAFVYDNVRGFLGSATRESGPGPDTPTGTTVEERLRAQQPLRTTVYNVKEAVRYNGVLLAGGFLYPLLLLVGGRGRGPAEGEERGFAVLTLCAWAGALGAAYLFWTLRRGFFQAYFLELVPPLAVLTAALAVGSWRRLPVREGWIRTAGALALVLALLVALHAAMGTSRLTISVYFFVPLALLAVFHLPKRGRPRGWVVAFLGIGALAALAIAGGPALPAPAALVLYAAAAAGAFFLLMRASDLSWSRERPAVASFASYALIVGAFTLTLADSVPEVGLAYNGVWTPETVKAVADELRSRTPPDGEVLSGAVIWELEAGRRPFMNLSHPLALVGAIPSVAAPPMLDRLESAPPSAVVLDGYTEQTYLPVIPELRSVLEERYRRTAVVEAGSRYPVEVYVQRETRSLGKSTEVRNAFRK